MHRRLIYPYFHHNDVIVWAAGDLCCAVSFLDYSSLSCDVMHLACAVNMQGIRRILLSDNFPFKREFIFSHYRVQDD
jgi:hypothetical protein